MSAAIYYHPEAYTTTGPKLMGRNAAGESFLRGFLQHTTAQTLWAQVESEPHAKHFAERAQAARPDIGVKALTRAQLSALSTPGCIYYPGPGIGEHAWHRAATSGHAAWSLCGITHTTSSDRAMDAITELITAPVQAWDAVICTSTAVKANVERVLQAQVDHLVQRLGVQRLVLPQLPVIPLGIHTADFNFDDKTRAAARKRIGAGAKTHVVLFMGRLSFHAKAHPLAMYQALERAAQGLPRGEKVVLVECGWHANDHIAKAFADAAARFCPSVRVVTLDGREAAQRETAWASADVFCSLSDNIQETFGITPIEAMAAGLPVVVSDWDGYRDTVRHEVDGYRIATTLPQPGLGRDLALRHGFGIDSYDMYCGHTCSLVAVDVEATAAAFAQLFADPALRRRMGEAGRQRARKVYDWAAIIPQYESLWAGMAELRAANGSNVQPLPHPWPGRLDPTWAFAGYATHSLTPETWLAACAVPDNTLERVAHANALRDLEMVRYARQVLPEESEVFALLEGLERGPRRAGQLIARLPAQRQAAALRGLVWLMKLGLVRLTEPPPEPVSPPVLAAGGADTPPLPDAPPRPPGT
jgi:glycosyltransferase involved in cell wall biosynthesis